LDWLQVCVPFDAQERAAIESRLNKNAKYAPFFISVITNGGIVVASTIHSFFPVFLTATSGP
jgi:hypothetical protein